MVREICQEKGKCLRREGLEGSALEAKQQTLVFAVQFLQVCTWRSCTEWAGLSDANLDLSASLQVCF